jgi:hypothetical protein
MRRKVVSGIRPGFPGLSQSQGQVTHVLLTRSPLIHPASWASSFDLHVLSTPPAFILSQDQTLRKKLQTQHHHPGKRANGTALNPIKAKKAPTRHPEEQRTETKSTKQNIWYQQTWHTIEFSNNRHTRHQEQPLRATPSLRSNFSNLPAPARFRKSAQTGEPHQPGPDQDPRPNPRTRQNHRIPGPR